jgi:hypothetical protein
MPVEFILYHLLMNVNRYAMVKCALQWWHNWLSDEYIFACSSPTKMYWLLRLKSHLTTSNKPLIYKAILKPIWTNLIQLWGTASTSNIEILERFQSTTLRMIVGAPWYVPNTVIRRDLQIPTVKDAICLYSSE